VTVIAVANQKGGVGKTTTAINVGVLLAKAARRRVLLIDSDPQGTLTRQLGIEVRALGVNLVDALAGRASAEEAIVTGVHGVDVIPGARDLAGVEMSLVGEVARERFLEDALEPLLERYDVVVVDTPPNLGLLTVNALASADRVLAPVSCEDEASVHGLLELQLTISRLVDRLGATAPEVYVVLTRWQPWRRSCRAIEAGLADCRSWPAVRIRSRSGALADAAARQVPLAVSAPDNTVTLGYHALVDELAGVNAG
jgi:chromosome partitioning protein